jgi:pimeloyl-ACP methyl ester carboxylesterase
MRRPRRRAGFFQIAACAAGLLAAAGSAHAAPPRTGTVTVPSGQLFYRDAGTGRPAVFVSALLIDSRLWLDQLDGLADVRRCLAFDFTGFGFSSPLRASQVDSRRYADELLQFLDALQVQEPVDVVALSAGGVIAALAYEKAPQRFRSLVLISTVFGAGLDAAGARYRAENARTVVIEGKDVLFRRFNEYIVSPDASLLARARYKTMLEQTPYESLVAFLTTQESLDTRALPGKIAIPVMLPVGQSDTVLTVAAARKLAPQFKDGRVLELSAAGRLLPLEAPAALNDAIRRFWRDLDAR